ncbi:Hsp20/alpha crystallin family protein [Aquibacillus salsiterrae]|uniref:Hsp20/alpha crystallin family protein n=1 Tax=Aquibacillus salsiterrae TaxID=2950439 RepID=A0A9X4AHS5_9BACI|nr:Hsp20/alpha crystallin family protein [Aquibacillus salsiterrae]MDC3418645.1 Hsp20/alpha crystallin family protein [Aquibacillus salsiterrae]
MSDESKKRKKKRELTELNNDLFQAMEHLFRSPSTSSLFDSIDSFFQDQLIPAKAAVDMYETDTEWVVLVDLPGVDKQNIYIDVIGDRLKIAVKDDQDSEAYDEQQSFYQRERRFFQTERVVQLPYEINKNETKAIYKNGVLDIRGPKTPKSNHRLDID